VAGPRADNAGSSNPRGATDLDAHRVSGARYGYAFVYDTPGRPARSVGLPVELSLSLGLPVGLVRSLGLPLTEQ
jgi:hypothetical protein